MEFKQQEKKLRPWSERFVMWLMLKLWVVVPMEGREGRPRLNVANPLAYIFLFLIMLFTWAGQVIGVVGAGFYNVVAVYISTVRAGWEDNRVVELGKELKQGYKQYQSEQGSMKVNK